MSSKSDSKKVQNRLRREIAISAQEADIFRHKTITQAIFHAMKDKPKGPSRDKSQMWAPKGPGWVPGDFKKITHVSGLTKQEQEHYQQLLKNMQPSDDEVELVLDELTKQGFVTVIPYIESEPGRLQMFQVEQTTYFFNKDYKTFQNLVVSGDDIKKEFQSPKRRRQHQDC